MDLRKWSVLVFVLFNVLLGSPGLFVFVSSLYGTPGKVWLAAEILLWMIGNLWLLRKRSLGVAAGYFCIAAALLIGSALLCSMPLFGFR